MLHLLGDLMWLSGKQQRQQQQQRGRGVTIEMIRVLTFVMVIITVITTYVIITIATKNNVYIHIFFIFFISPHLYIKLHYQVRQQTNKLKQLTWSVCEIKSLFFPLDANIFWDRRGEILAQKVMNVSLEILISQERRHFLHPPGPPSTHLRPTNPLTHPRRRTQRHAEGPNEHATGRRV